MDPLIVELLAKMFVTQDALARLFAMFYDTNGLTPAQVRDIHETVRARVVKDVPLTSDDPAITGLVADEYEHQQALFLAAVERHFGMTKG